MPVKISNFKTDAKKGRYYKVKDILKEAEFKISKEDLKALTYADVVYRALCSILYDFAPLSGHPGGSISSGRIVANLAYNVMSYDITDPDRDDADILSYAAGHKALGFYAMSALRNEIVRTYAPALLASEKRQLRLEDLLGFRHSLSIGTKLLKEFNVKPLDGHPVPISPFIKISTGASGVGVGSSVGLGIAAAAAYPQNSPKVNVIEGEGGLSAGRSAEALAIASAAGLDNVIFHLDWNQASIDSNKVTAENGVPGDYVSWTPAELFYINGFNVIEVPDGLDFKQVYAAQKFAYSLSDAQPTVIVYRTVKGWHYGIEGKASHGSGHKFASEGFYASLSEFEKTFKVSFPRFEGEQTPQNVEDYFWKTLLTVREVIGKNKKYFEYLAGKIAAAKLDLDSKHRVSQAPQTEKVYTDFKPQQVPAQFNYTVQDNPAIRKVMSEALAYISKETGGSMYVACADLSGSTGVGAIVKPYAPGFYNKNSNPQSRMVAGGGICEDGLSCVMSGVSAFGRQIGVAASYAAFTSAMTHTQARLHAIGQQCYQEATGKPKHTFVIFGSHAGISTGEDGPTHADPQCLQLIEEDFPKGAAITLTPLDGNDVWPLLSEALSKRPAVLYPVVTRPNVKIIDREALGGDPAINAKNGVYAISKVKGIPDGVIIVQGAGAGGIFVNGVLPELQKQGFKLNVYCVSSRELFTMLSPEKQEEILPFEDKKRAMAVTDFTLPTMYCWLKSENGPKMSVYPFKQDKYMTSGKAGDVYKEAHMDAQSQLAQVLEYLQEVKKTSWH